jgi:hypothetical protein
MTINDSSFFDQCKRFAALRNFVSEKVLSKLSVFIFRIIPCDFLIRLNCFEESLMNRIILLFRIIHQLSFFLLVYQKKHPALLEGQVIGCLKEQVARHPEGLTSQCKDHVNVLIQQSAKDFRQNPVLKIACRETVELHIHTSHYPAHDKKRPTKYLITSLSLFDGSSPDPNAVQEQET